MLINVNRAVCITNMSVPRYLGEVEGDGVGPRVNGQFSGGLVGPIAGLIIAALSTKSIEIDF